MSGVPIVSTRRCLGVVTTLLAGLASAAAVTLPAVSDGAAAAGNARAGRELARAACADCHRLPDGTGGGQARPLHVYRDQQPFSAAGLRKLVGSWPHAGAVELPPDPAYPDLAAFLNGLDQAAAADDGAPAERADPRAKQPDRRRGAFDRRGPYEREDHYEDEYDDEHEDDYDDYDDEEEEDEYDADYDDYEDH
jgi:hypothetical protein